MPTRQACPPFFVPKNNLEVMGGEMTTTEKIAEYLALAPTLEVSSSKAEYRRANELAYELAMTLPADVYREIVWAITNPGERYNPLTACIKTREVIMKLDGLDANELAHHAPGIGKKK